MKKVATKGIQVIGKKDTLIALNMGYGFHKEHNEESVHDMVNLFNDFGLRKMNGITGLKQKRRIEKEMKKYSSSAFYNSIILPNVGYLRREIIIDNTELKKNPRYTNIMLANGEYTMILVSNTDLYIDVLKKKMGNNRKFEESTFLYGGDYNYDVDKNEDAQLAKIHLDVGIGTVTELVSSAWDSSGFMVFIRKGISVTQGLADSIENSLKNSSLAVTYGPKGLFRDNGLCLVMLDNMYKLL